MRRRLEIVRERTKGEVEMTLASDALGPPDIAPLLWSESWAVFRARLLVELIRLCRVARVKVLDVTES